MTPMDTRHWRRFRIGELFTVVKGTRLTKAHMIPGNTNFVGASAMNNGITTRIGNTGHVFEAGAITVCYNGSVGQSFYQNEPFWASDDVNVLIPSERIDESAALFILPILRLTGTRYDFTDKWNQNAMENDQINLPSTPEGRPDWDYMSNFMKTELSNSSSTIDALLSAKLNDATMNDASWRPFAIGELFIIQKGTRLTRATMIPGTTPFIGATLENNGITAHVGNTGHIHPGGTITVAYNGQKATGKAFWQPKPFWASDDVNVLYPQFELTEEIALFLQPLFWEAGRPYSFGDKWSVARMERTPLTLPTQDDGTPDWNRMHRFMRTIMDNAGETIDHLDATPEPNI